MQVVCEPNTKFREYCIHYVVGRLYLYVNMCIFVCLFNQVFVHMPYLISKNYRFIAGPRDLANTEICNRYLFSIFCKDK